MPYFNQNMVNAYYKFQLLNNPLGQVPNTRNEFCIEFLHSAMPYALGRVFAESLLPKHTKVNVLLCVTSQNSELVSLCTLSSWHHMHAPFIMCMYCRMHHSISVCNIVSRSRPLWTRVREILAMFCMHHVYVYIHARALYVVAVLQLFYDHILRRWLPIILHWAVARMAARSLVLPDTFTGDRNWSSGINTSKVLAS